MPDFKNMFSEIREYLTEKYFSPDFESVDFVSGGSLERFFPMLIVGICAGAFLATVISYYNQNFLGRPVRRLIENHATLPESGKTLTEIGCDKAIFRRALCKNAVLKKYVSSEKNELSGETRYFIPEEKQSAAQKRFKPVRGGLCALFISFIVCTAACFILLYIAPDLIILTDNAIGMIK